MNNDISIQNMILMLPFEQAYKAELLHKLPTLERERASLVESIIRDLYRGIFSLRYEQNLQNALQELAPGTVMDEAFQETIRAQTTTELMQQLHAPDPAQLNLIGTRDKLQQVIGEKSLAS